MWFAFKNVFQNVIHVISCCTGEVWSQGSAVFTLSNLDRMSGRMYLDVGLRQCDHLGENVRHLQVLHLIPLPSSLIEHKDYDRCDIIWTHNKTTLVKQSKHKLWMFVIMPLKWEISGCNLRDAEHVSCMLLQWVSHHALRWRQGHKLYSSP